MADNLKYNLQGAALPDGTIDFYVLLGEAPTAETDVLRSKIQGLYAEAQANRDHRNLTRRREYQTLLELLPAARAALLEDPKRARYDAYLQAAQNGASENDFETFMNDLMGFNEQMEEKTGIIGRKNEVEPRVKPVKTVPQAQVKTQTIPAASSSASAGVSKNAIFGAVGGLIVGFLVGYVATKDLLPAILAAILVGAIGFFVLNKGGKTKISR